MLNVLAGAGLYACVSAAALAHAHPVSFSPAADTVVSTPGVIRISYDKPLEPASNIVITGEHEEPVGAGKTVIDAQDPTSMSVSLPPLPAAVYIVKWSAGSSDGHTNKGSYKFTVK